MSNPFPVFAKYLKQTSFWRNHLILFVLESGNVYISSLAPDHNIYKYPNYLSTPTFFGQLIKGIIKGGEILHDNYDTSHVINPFLSNPVCIGTVKFKSNSSDVKIEYIPEREHLIITGIIYKKIPSIGVYQISLNSIELIFAESLLSISDLTYSSYIHSYIALPRLSNSSIILFNSPRNQINFNNYDHRLIPEILFAGSHMKRVTHISSGGTHKWHCVSWSDDLCPTIILWSFSSPTENDKYWNSNVYNFLFPCYIRQVEIDPTSEKIGILIEQETMDFFCIWKIEGNKVVQHNFELSRSFCVRQIKWVRSLVNPQKMVLALTTHGTYYEHHLNEIKKWSHPLYKLEDLCCEYSDDKFFFNDDGILSYISGNDFKELLKMENLEAKCIAPFPIIKNQMNGICDSLTGLHLYRCAKCKRPLLYPLVSLDHLTGLKRCYCSHKCQMEHWPTYVAVHQPLDFNFEELDDGK